MKDWTDEFLSFVEEIQNGILPNTIEKSINTESPTFPHGGAVYSGNVTC